MIQANELRIGNLLQLPYENNITYTVRGCDIGFLEDGMDPNCFEAIPLNEEWLIKAGSTRQISYIGKVYDCHGLQVYETDDDGWHLGNEETHLEIESVHQLQNLYFALTGEELNIKS